MKWLSCSGKVVCIEELRLSADCRLSRGER
jgi:hypothetical protein